MLSQKDANIDLNMWFFKKKCCVPREQREKAGEALTENAVSPTSSLNNAKTKGENKGRDCRLKLVVHHVYQIGHRFKNRKDKNQSLKEWRNPSSKDRIEGWRESAVTEWFYIQNKNWQDIWNWEKMWRSFKSAAINGTIHMKYEQMQNQGSEDFKESDSLDVKNMVKKTDS